MKMIFYYKTTFLLLSFFMLSAFGILPRFMIKRAYADAISQIGAPKHGTFVLFPSIVEKNDDNHLLKRVDKLIEHQLICELSPEEYNELSHAYNLSTEQVEYEGKSLTLAKVPSKNTNVNKVYEYLTGQHKRPAKCDKLKYKNFLYFLLGAQVN